MDTFIWDLLIFSFRGKSLTDFTKSLLPHNFEKNKIFSKHITVLNYIDEVWLAFSSTGRRVSLFSLLSLTSLLG